MKANPAGSSFWRVEGAHPRPQWTRYSQAWGNRDREQEKVEGENRGGGSGEGGGNRRKEGARMGSRGSWADWLR